MFLFGYVKTMDSNEVLDVWLCMLFVDEIMKIV